MSELLAEGVRRVISLNDGLLVHPEDLADAGIEYARFPLPDNVPPRSDDVEPCIRALDSALAFLQGPLEHGGGVIVHCSSGKDRTGLFLCYYLVKLESYSPRDAICEVRRVRPIALTAEGWEDFAHTVLQRVAN